MKMPPVGTYSWGLGYGLLQVRLTSPLDVQGAVTIALINRLSTSDRHVLFELASTRSPVLWDWLIDHDADPLLGNRISCAFRVAGMVRNAELWTWSKGETDGQWMTRIPLSNEDLS